MAGPLLLSLDTATASCCVALTTGTIAAGRVLGAITLTGAGGCSRRLLAAIDSLMAETGTSWGDIDGIGVGLGPGSFTGLRIGMATGKGLAVAAGVGLHGVSTLDSLAAACPSERLVVSVLDARRRQVYTARYRHQPFQVPGLAGLAGSPELPGWLRRLGEPEALSPEDCAAALAEPVLLVGDGALLYAELFAARLGENFALAAAPCHQPSAVWLGMLAAEQLLAGEALDLQQGVPLYIRRADATLPGKGPVGAHSCP